MTEEIKDRDIALTFARSGIPIATALAVKSLRRRSVSFSRAGDYVHGEEPWWQLSPKDSRISRQALIRIWTKYGMMGAFEVKSIREFMRLGVGFSSAVRASEILYQTGRFGLEECNILKAALPQTRLGFLRQSPMIVVDAAAMIAKTDQDLDRVAWILRTGTRHKAIARSPILAHISRAEGLHGNEATFQAAEVYSALKAGRSSILDLLRRQDLSIAIVGNSPCEIGKSKGAEIDAHDIVIRFNHAGVPEKFHKDYGKKLTISVLNSSTLHHAMEQPLDEIKAILISGPKVDRLYQRTPILYQLLEQGPILGMMPIDVQQKLTACLGSPPSSGFQVIATTFQSRGNCNNVSFYGFGFIDQLEAHAEYAANPAGTVMSFKHNWIGELELFKAFVSNQIDRNLTNLPQVTPKYVRSAPTAFSC